MNTTASRRLSSNSKATMDQHQLITLFTTIISNQLQAILKGKVILRTAIVVVGILCLLPIVVMASQVMISKVTILPLVMVA